jgi:AraC-like DNA-binding protein
VNNAGPREPLLSRIELYIREHLGDQALSARQIAAAHSISVRQLHYLWSDRDRTVTEWIIAERLAAAARELAAPDSSAAIAAVARRWGFVNPAHFSRRFKDRYGVTPRGWRHLHQAKEQPVNAAAAAPCLPDGEAAQVSRANASGKTPVVFVRGRWLLPASRDR